jgi:hypothetical protein
MYILWRRDSSVDIAQSTHWTVEILVQGQIPCRSNTLLSSPHSLDRLQDLLNHLSCEFRRTFPGVKRPGLEANHSAPSSVAFVNLYLDFHIYFHGVVCN